MGQHVQTPGSRSTGQVAPVERALRLVSASALLGMMGLAVADIILRRAFRSPIPGTFELIQLFMVLFVFSALPEATRSGAHIRVDVVTSRLPEPARRFLYDLTHLWSLVFFGLLAWRNGLRVGELWVRGETLSFLAVPLFPIFAWIAVSCGLVTLVMIARLAESLSGPKRNARPTAPVAVAAVLLLGVLVPAVLWRVLQNASAVQAGLIGIGVLLSLLATGLPIAFSLGLAGLLGIASQSGWGAGLAQLSMVPYGTGSEYTLAAVPLFLLMGQLAGLSGLSRDLYDTSQKWLGHLPGGLAMSTVAGCAAFAAVSGSSVATSATMAAAALPEMKRYGYDERLALGSVAAGGTLGILIPPSLVFILYGIMTEQSIGRLFMAGILPGILSMILYLLTIWLLVRINPGMGPPTSRFPFRVKALSLTRVWGVLCLFLLIMGGIYMGIFTPTEAGAVGAFGAFLLLAVKGKFSMRGVLSCLIDTSRTTTMLVTVFIGATLFTYFLAATRLPSELVSWLSSASVSPAAALTAVIVIYLLLGSIMDPGSMILLTTPLLYPLIHGFGFDSIWFGVIVVVAAEIGCITPPIGINVFVVHASTRDVPLATIYRGILPFLGADAVRLLILMLVPPISLFLPNLLR